MKTVFTSILLTLCMSLSARLPETLTGNWINRETSEWEYGFFEEFAIYESDFWEYESVKSQGNKTVLTLKKGECTVNLETENKGGNNLLNIKNGKNKTQQYILAGNSYPDYPVKDHATFPAPNFTQDSVTIKGYYRNLDKIPEQFGQQYGRRFFSIMVSDYVTDSEKEYFTDIDSLGRFSITIPVVNTQETYADWRRITKNIMLEPGCNLFLFVDINDFLPFEGESWKAHKNRPKQIICMGKNARVNNELMQYATPDIYIDRYAENVKNMPHMEYLELCKDNYSKRMQYLNEYISVHPTVSEKFRFYLAEREKYASASDIMQRRFDLARNTGERFPDGYMEYVKDKFSITDERIFTLVRDFRFFLRDYVGYEQPTNSFTRVDLNMAGKKLEEEGKMTEEINTDIAQYNNIIRQLEQLTDSTEKAEFVNAQAGFFEKINKNAVIAETFQKLFRSRSLDREIALADTIITNPRLKELYFTSLYNKMFDSSRLPLDNSEINTLNKRITEPYLRKTLMDTNRYYASLGQKSMEYEESLKNTDHLESVMDAEELFRQLTETYRGKVVYLDIWGTWCSPCRENMKLMGGIKEALSGKDIIFMYLANNSPEPTWRSIIKEMGLTGENTVHYNLPGRQQELLEKHFSIKQHPTYMLIDREGNIVNRNALSPKEKDGLIREIEKLLN